MPFELDFNNRSGFTQKVEAETTVIFPQNELHRILRAIQKLKHLDEVDRVEQTMNNVPMEDLYFSPGFASARIRRTDGKYQIDLKDKKDVPPGDDVIRIRREMTANRTKKQLEEDFLPLLIHFSSGMKKVEKDRTEFLVHDRTHGKVYFMIDRIREASLQRLKEGKPHHNALELPLGKNRLSLEIEISRRMESFQQKDASDAIHFYLKVLGLRSRGEALSVRRRLLKILMEKRTAERVFGNPKTARHNLRIIERTLCENSDEETLKKRLRQLDILPEIA